MPSKNPKRKTKLVESEDETRGTAEEHPRKKTRILPSPLEEQGAKRQRPQIYSKASTPSWADWQTTFNKNEKDDRRRFAAEFNELVDQARKSICECLENSKENFDRAVKNHDSIFGQARIVAQRNFESARKMANGGADPEGHPLFCTGQRLLATCRGIIAAHEKGNEKSPRQEEMDQIAGLKAQFDEDKSSMEKVLKCSVQQAARLVADNIDLSRDHKESSLTPLLGRLDALSELAMEMQKGSLNNAGSDSITWGESAVSYIEYFTRLLATSERKSQST